MEMDYGLVCPECELDLNWEDCTNCVDGFTHHDCGEDVCCCLYPMDNAECNVCYGASGWWRCYQNKCGIWTEDKLNQSRKGLTG